MMEEKTMMQDSVAAPKEQVSKPVTAKSFKKAFYITLVLLIVSLLGNILLGFAALDRTIRVNELLENDGQQNIDGRENDRPNDPTQEVPGTDKTSFVVEFEEMTIAETYGNYDIEGKYPVVSVDGFENTAINSEIEDFLNNIRDQATSDLLADESSQLYTEFDFEVITASNGAFISIVFDGSDYFGGAHPTPFRKTMVFDVTPDRTRMTQLSHLFRPDTDYLDQLSAYSYAELSTNERIADLETLETGTNPAIENFNVWHLTDDGIVVYFGAYQVAAYAAGTFEVVIPFSELEDFVYVENFN